MLNNSHRNVYNVMDDLPSHMAVNSKDNTNFGHMVLPNVFDGKGSNEVMKQATRTIEVEDESGHQTVNELEDIFTSSSEGSETYSENTIVVNLHQGQFPSTHLDVNKFVEPLAEKTDQRNLVKHICIKCDGKFVSLNKYQDHLRWHKCQKKFKCTKCLAGYNVENNLKIHMILNHPSEDNRSCPICNVTLTYQRAAGMKSHLMIHQVEELHSCEKCLAEFEKEDDYVKHMKSHKSGERAIQPFTCSHCQVHFENRKDYRSHISEHQRARRIFAKPKRTRKYCLPDAKRFHCKICDKSFIKFSLLERHERIHSGEKPYQCDQCDQSFAQKGTLQTHYKKHTGSRPFVCTMCPAKFAQKGNLKVHIRKTHTFPDKSDKMYKCPHCTCIFKKIAPLNGHVTKVHLNKSGAPENVLLDVMKNLKELDKQTNQKIVPITTEHGNKPENVSKNEKIVSVLKDEFQNRGYVQEKSFVTLTESIYDGSVKKHVVQHKKVGDVHWYCCEYCPKQCKKPSDLIRHIRVHTKEKPFKCKQCMKTFTLKSTLLSHKKTHNTSFKCNTCDAGFGSTRVLNNHIRDHEFKKLTKWVCTLCKCIFDDFEKALTHKKENGQSHAIQSVLNSVIKQPLYHTVYGNLVFKPPRPRIPNTGTESPSKRPFHCTTCDARFTRKVNLTRHLQYHANDRKYKCYLCPKTYITACRLKEHLNYHNNIKKYGCKVCSKRFVTPTLLKRHMIIHNTSKPYMCPYCSKHYKTILLCRHHIQLIHKKDALPKFVGKDLVEFITSGNHASEAPETESTDGVLVPCDEETPITEPMTSDALLIQKELATQSTSCDVIKPDYLITHDGGDYQTLYVTMEDLELLKNSNLVLDSSVNSHMELLNSDNSPSEHILDGSNVVLINSNTEPNLVDTNVLQLDGENLLTYDMHALNDLNVPVDDSEQIFGNNAVLRTSSRFSETENIFDENIICMNCNKVFSNFAIFPKHRCEKKIANVDGTTSRPGDVLNEEVASKHVRSRHLKKHPNKGGYECVICELFFSGKTAYLQHMSSHTPYDNSHTCKFCNKIFKKASDLERHHRVHTGEKPFGCNICNKSFSLKSTLLSHMRTHNPNSKEYNCHICNSFYSSRSSLRVHMSVHTGQKPFSCHFCKMKFRTSANRKSHEVLKHTKKKKGTGELKNKITDVLESVASEMAVINCPCNPESETCHSQESTPVQNDDIAPEHDPQLEEPSQIISLDVVPEDMLTTISEGQITIDPSLLLHQIQMSDIVLTTDAAQLNSYMFNEVSLIDLEGSSNNLQIISLPQATDENGVTISISEVEEKQERKNSIQCDICKKFYASNNVLRRHKKNLHGEKPNYSCSQCHKNFRSKVTFLRHCKTHPELNLLLNQDGTNEVIEESLNTDMEREHVDVTRDATSSLLNMKFDLSSATIDDPLFDSLFSIKKA